MRYEVYEWDDFQHRLLTSTNDFSEALSWCTYSTDRIYDTATLTWVS